MDINKIPYTVENLIKEKQRTDNILIYNENTTLNKYLIEKKYLKKNTIEENFSSNYNIYNASKEFLKLTVDDILKDMIGMDLDTYKNNRFVDFENLHINSEEDFENLIDELIDTDGFMSKMNIESKELSSCLIMHGFAERCGPNGYSLYGTTKLSKYSVEAIFKLVTNKTFDDYKNYLTNKIIENEKKELKRLAEKYGYDLIKKD